MAHSSEHIATRASELIESEGGFSAFVKNVILGGIVYGFGLQVIDALSDGFLLLLGPVRALGRGMILLIDSTIGNVVSVFDAGTQATVLSFTDGAAAALGPLAQPTSVGVGMLSIAVFLWSINRLEISPLSFIRSVRS